MYWMVMHFAHPHIQHGYLMLLCNGCVFGFVVREAFRIVGHLDLNDSKLEGC